MKHKHADLIHAWADGAQIQFFNIVYEEWDDTPYPCWDEKGQYRIKPEPKPDIFYKAKIVVFTGGVKFDYGTPNIELIFDGETNKLKSAEVLK